MHETPPSFTVVVPTYNRRQQLAECLDSLAGLDYPRDRFEVLIVDDQSDRSPEDIVAAYRDRIDVRLIVQPHGGPARARNAGARAARGDFLAFTDDDCRPARDWLSQLAAAFAQNPGHAIGGRTINRLARNPYATASQLLVDYLYAYFVNRKGRFFTSNNLAVPTTLFREVGGFDPDMPLAAAEDREFCVRWSKRGYPLLDAPAAIIEHAHPLDFRGFCRQHFNYGRGAYYYRRIVAAREGDGLSVEPLRFYSDLLKYPLARRPGLPSLGLSLLLVVSQAANVWGFVYEKVMPCHNLEPGGTR